jgi:hypothetical protein
LGELRCGKSTRAKSRHFGRVTLGDQLLRTGFLTRSIRN